MLSPFARRTNSITAVTLSFAGLMLPVGAWASTDVSGLTHTALGSATLDTPVGRRLPVRNIGSSGQDGVEIQLHSTYGGGVGIDPSALSTPGSEIRIRPKGWDGTIKGHLRLAGTGGGFITETQDFSVIGATALDWRVLGVGGKVLAQGQVSGASITYELSHVAGAKIDCFSRHADGGIMENENTLPAFDSVFTVSGLGSAVITNAADVIVTPRTCLGCPPPFVDVQSALVTGVGVTGFDVIDARLKTFHTDCYGVGTSHISEECTPICCPSDCDDTDRRLVVTNIGSSGQDGVAFDNIGSQGSENGSLKDRVAVSVSMSATSLLPVIPIEMEMRKRCPDCPIGHITLIKVHDTEDQATGARSVGCDVSGRGAAECTVRFYDSGGALLKTATLSNAASLSGPGCPGGPSPTYTLDRDGMLTFVPCVRPWSCFAGGALVTGIDRITFEPISPTVSAGPVDSCVVTGTDLASLVVDDLSVKNPVYASGIPHIALGGATLGPVSGRHIPIRNIGSSGQDGVEVKWRSMWGGGTSVDITPLLGPSSTPRSLQARYKGWDGMIKGRCTATFNPDGSLSEVYDFSPVNAAAVHWELSDEFGQLISAGTIGGSILSWTLDIPSSATEVNKRFAVSPGSGSGGGGGGGSGGSAARKAGQGFFDVAITAHVPGLPPIDGVHYLSVEPEPCAGLPENCPPSWTDAQSVEISTSGIPELTLLDADIGTFGAACSGLGTAHLDEECENGLPCEPNQRRLPVRNLGSSGEDGVAIDLGHGATGGQLLRSKRCPECPFGHVILMKFEDAAGETFRMTSAENPATGAIDLHVDASGLGASSMLATFHDALGADIASTILSNGQSISHPACASGAPTRLRWDGIVYVYGGCDAPMDYSLPSGSGVSGAASVSFKPLSPAHPRAASRLEMTSDDPEGFVVHGVSIHATLLGDMNCDGATNNFDIDPFVIAILSAPDYWAAYPACNRSNGDIDQSGAVNNFDIDPFVGCILSGGCN